MTTIDVQILEMIVATKGSCNSNIMYDILQNTMTVSDYCTKCPVNIKLKQTGKKCGNTRHQDSYMMAIQLLEDYRNVTKPEEIFPAIF